MDKPKTWNRGFASMTPEKRKEIARKGGLKKKYIEKRNGYIKQENNQ